MKASSPNHSPNAPLSPAPIHRRWRRRAIISVAAVAAIWLLHAPLLRGVGRFLAADEPLDKADFIVILPSMTGDRLAIENAAERVRRGGASGLIFFRMPPARSERCGAWPDYETAIGDDLKSRGIAESSIVTLPGPSHTSWQAARALGKWLEERPALRLDILTRRLGGRYERHVFASVLPERMFDQLHFGAAENRIDETNWWHDREGIQMVFQNYIQLAFIELYGETESNAGTWTLEQYEQSLPPALPAP